MPPTHPRQSRFVTLVALLFLGWGALVALNVVGSEAWNPDSHFWDHSDLLWAREYVGGPLTPEVKSLMAAQARAQMRYELPIKGTLTAESLVALVAALGLLWRQNWVRWLLIGVMACMVLEVAWITVLFLSLRLADTSDVAVRVVIVVGLGSIGWKLRSQPL